MSSVWTQNTLEMLANVRQQLYEGQLFRAPRTDGGGGAMTAAARRAYATSAERYATLRPQDVRVHEKTLRMLTDIVKLEKSLYGADPAKMFMYNKQRTVRADAVQRPWANPQRVMYTDTRKTADSWEKVEAGH